MRLQEKLRIFVTGFLMGSMMLAVTVTASRQWAMREITYGDINVVVDGAAVNFAADMQPFITQDRTFLPIRAISEALGIDVNWNDATRTVYVGEMPATVPNNHPLVGRWTGSSPNTLPVPYVPYIDHDFEFLPDGTGHSRGSFPFTFYWTVQNGQLRITVADGGGGFVDGFVMFENYYYISGSTLRLEDATLTRI